MQVHVLLMLGFIYLIAQQGNFWEPIPSKGQFHTGAMQSGIPQPEDATNLNKGKSISETESLNTKQRSVPSSIWKTWFTLQRSLCVQLDACDAR
jgi:hypothetical protein